LASYSQAEGEATATKMRASAQAEAIKIISTALEGNLANDAAKLDIARAVRCYYDCFFCVDLIYIFRLFFLRSFIDFLLTTLP
jgi:hypothetical protein